MIKKLILLVFVVYGSVANAGWYRIGNYSGVIGNYPAHISIQSLEGVDEATFSAEGMDGLGDRVQFVGVYYYDKYKSPIALYGRKNGSGGLRLCEVNNEERFRREVLNSRVREPVDVNDCQFELSIENGEVSGVWTDGKKKYAVSLREDGRLTDLDEEKLKIHGFLEIPFWGRNSKYLTVGFYNYVDPLSPCCVNMSNLVLFSRDVVRWPNSEVELTQGGGVGMGKALIYQSVENLPRREGSGFLVHNRDGSSHKVFYESKEKDTSSLDKGGQQSGYYKVGACVFVPSLKSSKLLQQDLYHLNVLASANDAGFMKEMSAYDLGPSAAIKEIVQLPRHGVVNKYKNRRGEADYFYSPELGYVGNDRVVFRVSGFDSAAGVFVVVDMMYGIRVTPEQGGDYFKDEWLKLSKKYCPNLYWLEPIK